MSHYLKQYNAKPKGAGIMLEIDVATCVSDKTPSLKDIWYKILPTMKYVQNFAYSLFYAWAIYL